MGRFTFISFILFCLAIGYLHKNHKLSIAPNIANSRVETGPTQSSITKKNEGLPDHHVTTAMSRANQRQNLNPRRKGKFHESRTAIANSKQKNARIRKNEDVADATGEIKKFTSIYGDQEGRERSEQAVDNVVSDLNSESDLQGPQTQPKPAVAGINVAAWIRSQKNHLNTDVPDPEVGSGIRVFLNCMELKSKGANSLEDKECGRLLARKEAVTKSASY